MSHQAEGDMVYITTFSPESHHNKPEEHKPPKDNFDEDIDLETALTSL